jgi:Rrf2 family protein
MQLTRAADYGVRALIHLADVESHTRSSLTDLAEVAGVTPAFLSKVLQRLVQAGFVASKRGKRGGFELLPHARTATLLEILLALDGVPELNICLAPDGCHRSSWCAAHPVWQEAQDRMREVLASITLEQLAHQSRERRVAAASS